MKNEHVWQIRIGGPVTVPPGGDAPMRNAVERAFEDLFEANSGCFSGWGHKWVESEFGNYPEFRESDRVWECRIGGDIDASNLDASFRLRGAAMCAYLKMFDATPRFVFSKLIKWTDSEIEVLKGCKMSTQLEMTQDGINLASEFLTRLCRGKERQVVANSLMVILSAFQTKTGANCSLPMMIGALHQVSLPDRCDDYTEE